MSRRLPPAQPICAWGSARPTRWRAGGAGAATDGGSDGDTISRAGAVVAAGGTVGGTALCATGRAFGSGTLCFAGAERRMLRCRRSPPVSPELRPSASLMRKPLVSPERKLPVRNKPSASVKAADRTVDNADDRNALARTSGLTAFLRCESIG